MQKRLANFVIRYLHCCVITSRIIITRCRHRFYLCVFVEIMGSITKDVWAFSKGLQWQKQCSFRRLLQEFQRSFWTGCSKIDNSGVSKDKKTDAIHSRLERRQTYLSKIRSAAGRGCNSRMRSLTEVSVIDNIISNTRCSRMADTLNISLNETITSIHSIFHNVRNEARRQVAQQSNFELLSFVRWRRFVIKLIKVKLTVVFSTKRRWSLTKIGCLLCVWLHSYHALVKPI